ncbi:MAG: hypothetical protein IJG02_07930 [Thermoguttaceae bacterium]|nr:hypothetical protein [Thermoguttaceae bacterium]
MEEIKKLLMEMGKDLFDSFAGDPGDGGVLLGRPPRVFYLDFSYEDGRGNQDARVAEEQLETYRYENGSLEKVEPGTENETEPGNRAYFEEGRARISIDRINNYAFFSFQVGPLFGRGYRYKILEGENGKTLGEEEMLWIS